MSCTRKLAKAITPWLAGFSIKDEPKGHTKASCEKGKGGIVCDDKPKPNDLTNRFEDINELIL
jgi:hypothetical protein